MLFKQFSRVNLQITTTVEHECCIVLQSDVSATVKILRENRPDFNVQHLINLNNENRYALKNVIKIQNITVTNTIKTQGFFQ